MCPCLSQIIKIASFKIQTFRQSAVTITQLFDMSLLDTALQSNGTQ